MRTSHSTITALLSSYGFVDHVFFARHSCSVVEVKRSIAFYAHYGLRILRMCLPRDWTEPLVDRETRRPVLPASLIALSLGAGQPADSRSLVWPASDGCGSMGRVVDGEEPDTASSLDARLRRWERDNCCDTWADVFEHGVSQGRFNQPIPPGALPHGLRFLECSRRYNQSLLVGSIPDTVEALQFGESFNRILRPDQLPASLTHLSFEGVYNQPLLPGVLPAGLRLLHLGVSYNQPIPPGHIPPSVTHLRLSRCFDHVLECGSIQHGVLRLHLGQSFNQPLLPGVLPLSLTELVVSQYYNQLLQPGSLPDGLKVLVFHKWAKFQHALQPGVVPASVRVVSLGEQYEQELVPGGIPSTVEWLRLPSTYAATDLTGRLSPSTHVVWWQSYPIGCGG